MNEEQAVVVRSEQLPASGPEDKIVPTGERYRGISMERANTEQTIILTEPLLDEDIEVKPDGMLYYPEIKYRRKLISAFGPGGWALMPTSKFDMRDKTVMRQYALYVGGRFISEVVGEQDYIENNPNMTYATAAEGCKSNALMRCCKDLGIASELWDPGFIEKWKAQFTVKAWNPKTSKWNWRRKDREPFFWEKKEGKPDHQQTATKSHQYEPPPIDDSMAGNPENDTDPAATQQESGDPISDPQAKRMFAIAMKAGWSKETMKEALERMGYQHSKDIKRSHYEDIVSMFEAGPR